MTITPSVKNFFIITLIAIIGILVAKFVVTKLPLPNGVKATVNAV